MWNEGGGADADHELSSIDQQMERVVAEAEAAAATVRVNLEEAKRTREEMLRAAYAECDELRVQAEAFAAETRDEAERNRIRTEALAEDLLQRARAEAEEIRVQALADAAETRTRAEAIYAILDKQLPALDELRSDLKPLLKGHQKSIAPAALDAPLDPAPVAPPAAQPERFLHPSAGLGIEVPSAPPALHVVEPVAGLDAVGVAEATGALEYGTDLG